MELCFYLFLPFAVRGAIVFEDFTQVNISRNRLSVPDVQISYHSIDKGLIYMAGLCLLDSSCICFCQLEEGGYLSTDFYVSPSAAETSVANETTCYTSVSRTSIYPPDGDVSGTPGQSVYGLSTVTDWFHDYSIYDCYHAAEFNFPPYVLVHFSSVQRISSVSMMTQPIGSLHNTLLLVEVRVGNSSANGNFSSYELLGSFIGPPAEYRRLVTVEGPTPKWGKYVSIQNIQSDGTMYELTFCTLEIF